MADDAKVKAPVVPGYNTSDIRWTQLRGSPKFDYPIDYWIAILAVHPKEGRVDFLSKWAPNSYCHFHRHLGPTTILVLEGEQHVVEKKATETVHKIRKAGHFGRNPGPDVHMEYGGPEGCVMFFSMEAVDGKLFDVLDKDERILRTVTIEEFANREF